jgi:short-chain fatty acids transporter
MLPTTEDTKADTGQTEAGFMPLAGLGSALTNWMERWFPDAFVFAVLITLIVFVAGWALGCPASDLADKFGEGFWGLIPFTMQMVMIILGGYVMASSPPVCRLIGWLANFPSTPRGAVALVASVATSTSLISYGFSLIFAGFLAREIAQRAQRPLSVDYRALGAAAYLGLGSVWALGLSSSAALLMATKSAMPPELLKISGVIPLSQTIYTWQSIFTAFTLMAVSVAVACLSMPTGTAVRTAKSFGVLPELLAKPLEPRRTPGEWLEYSPLLSVLIALLGFAYLGRVIAAGGLQAALTLNTYNFLFLILGLLLHWRPRSFTRAVSVATPATAGVLIQFPFYAGIFGMISFSPISRMLANLFVHASNHSNYPLLVSIYSALLGFFVPSGGGKWLIEAPYVMTAAHALKVSPGWIVQVYNTAEALPNLINPFWMLPLLGILKMKARDLAGYGLLQLLILAPVVFFLMWFLARTFTDLTPPLSS